MRKIYFQLQYQDVHSDGCGLDIDDHRQMLHELLDEFLNRADPSPKNNILEEPHFIVAFCNLKHGD